MWTELQASRRPFLTQEVDCEPGDGSGCEGACCASLVTRVPGTTQRREKRADSEKIVLHEHASVHTHIQLIKCNVFLKAEGALSPLAAHAPRIYKCLYWHTHPPNGILLEEGMFGLRVSNCQFLLIYLRLECGIWVHYNSPFHGSCPALGMWWHTASSQYGQWGLGTPRLEGHSSAPPPEPSVSFSLQPSLPSAPGLG